MLNFYVQLRSDIFYSYSVCLYLIHRCQCPKFQSSQQFKIRLVSKYIVEKCIRVILKVKFFLICCAKNSIHSSLTDHLLYHNPPAATTDYCIVDNIYDSAKLWGKKFYRLLECKKSPVHRHYSQLSLKVIRWSFRSKVVHLLFNGGWTNNLAEKNFGSVVSSYCQAQSMDWIITNSTNKVF